MPQRPSSSIDSLRTKDDYFHAMRAELLLHWLLTLGAAGYAWQLVGLWGAAGVLIALLLVISATNMFLLALFGSLRAVRLNRWGWVVLAYLGLAASFATKAAV